ncbi:MAG: hypothetical protein ACKOEX_13160, partial [Planctomycetia bacterium]
MSTSAPPDIASIVRQVIAELAAGQPQARPGHAGSTASQPSAASGPGGTSLAGAHGIFGSVDEAVRAAHEAFEQLERLGVEGRKKAIAHIRRIAIDDAEELGRMEFAETQIGRLEHKIE